MNIEALQPLAADTIPAIAEKAPAATADFSQWMSAQINDVNTQITSAQTGLAHLATGETGNLHHVMLELSKARLAFQLTLQIRNKVLEGYQDIMRMQL
jgi:flagellar hook-basal body complex protein FliE